MQATIEWIGNRRLREKFDLWKHTNELRDREMLQIIFLYAARNAGLRGVFLVGAAHRKSIIDMAFVGDGPGAPLTEWDLGGFLEEPG